MMTAGKVLQIILERIRESVIELISRVDSETPKKIKRELKLTLQNLAKQSYIPFSIAILDIDQIFRYTESDTMQVNADVSTSACKVKIEAVWVLKDYLQDLRANADMDYEEFMVEHFSIYELQILEA